MVAFKNSKRVKDYELGKYRFSNDHECRNKVPARGPWGKSRRLFPQARVPGPCSYTSGSLRTGFSHELLVSHTIQQCYRVPPCKSNVPVKTQWIFVYPSTLFCTSYFYIQKKTKLCSNYKLKSTPKNKILQKKSLFLIH